MVWNQQVAGLLWEYNYPRLPKTSQSHHQLSKHSLSKLDPLLPIVLFIHKHNCLLQRTGNIIHLIRWYSASLLQPNCDVLWPRWGTVINAVMSIMVHLLVDSYKTLWNAVYTVQCIGLSYTGIKLGYYLMKCSLLGNILVSH